MKNAKNTPVKTEKKMLSAAERWYIQTSPDVAPRLMTDADKPAEAIYYKLARNPESKGTYEEVAAECAATHVKFILHAMPQLQADEKTWAVVARVHPVIQRRQMIAAERRSQSLEQVESRYGKAAAALLGKKEVKA